MNALIINDKGEKIIECKDMKFENGFIIFDLENNTELFVNPIKVLMMEVTGRLKKVVKKPKITKTSSGGQSIP